MVNPIPDDSNMPDTIDRLNEGIVIGMLAAHAIPIIPGGPNGLVVYCPPTQKAIKLTEKVISKAHKESKRCFNKIAHEPDSGTLKGLLWTGFSPPFALGVLMGYLMIKPVVGSRLAIANGRMGIICEGDAAQYNLVESVTDLIYGQGAGVALWTAACGAAVGVH